MINQYETVFILNPVLSEIQVKETVKEYESFLKSEKAKIVSVENWGLKKLAYPIQNKKSGFYQLIEYKLEGVKLDSFEIKLKRDERVMRYLSVKLDKDAISWAGRRREKLASKNKRD